MKQLRLFATVALALLWFNSCGSNGTQPEAEAAIDNIYQFSVYDCDSNLVPLSDYQGQVLLVVNTATHCGFTPQYGDLQKLYLHYHDRGLEILDFPCNQFGEQAPGSNADIHAFCTGTYSTTFPQMAKIEVNGDSADALYTWLKSQAGFGGFDTTNRIGAYLDQVFRSQDSLYDQDPDIKWNFTKFLIDREGNVVRRFEPTADIADIDAAIQALL